MNKYKVGLGVVSLSSTFLLLLLKYTEAISSAIQEDRRHCTIGPAKGKVPPSITDYTTINRRLNRLDIKVENDNKNKEF
jgi:hypothetical protein